MAFDDNANELQTNTAEPQTSTNESLAPAAGAPAPTAEPQTSQSSASANPAPALESNKKLRPRLVTIIAAVLIVGVIGGAVAYINTHKATTLPHVTIGTLATEDILPMWVAEEEDMFTAEGLDVSIEVFQSATELIAGIMSGEVDYAMTDPLVAASIFTSGTDVRIEWITLGTTAAQGRFGIMTCAESGITTVEQLRDAGIAVGSNTMLEYVMEKLLAKAGITTDQFTKVEVQKLPVRYQSMVSNQVNAAVLPAGLLAMGEAANCLSIVDDTKGENLSQSVMISRLDFLSEKEGGADTLEPLKAIWNKAAKRINNNNSGYRHLLVEKGAISESLADTYKVSNYPTTQLPKNETIDPVLAWMLEKGYLTVGLKYNETDGTFSAAL